MDNQVEHLEPEDTMSPAPQRVDPSLTFPEAIQKVIDGRKITKREWNDKDTFGFLGEDGHLKIALPGKLVDWILSEGDLKGEDWEVVIEAN